LPPDKLPPIFQPPVEEGPARPPEEEKFAPPKEMGPLFGRHQGGHDWRWSDCREIWMQITLLRWGVWTAQETIRDMEERKVPEEIIHHYRRMVESDSADLAKLEEEYRFLGCKDIDWTEIPDEIPW
jgi:hypothetical protein